MSIVRFYLDEDCQSAALASALREHGIDAATTNEVGNAGAGDDAQLQACLQTQVEWSSATTSAISPHRTHSG